MIAEALALSAAAAPSGSTEPRDYAIAGLAMIAAAFVVWLEPVHRWRGRRGGRR